MAAARTGEELLAQCRTAQPDLVITDIKMPGLDGIAAAAEIFRERPTPVILVSAYHEPEVERAGAECVFGYLVKPIKEADLPPVIAVAMGRFDRSGHSSRRPPTCGRALEDRKMVEQAKGVLMRRSGADELQTLTGGGSRSSRPTDGVSWCEAARWI